MQTDVSRSQTPLVSTHCKNQTPQVTNPSETTHNRTLKIIRNQVPQVTDQSEFNHKQVQDNQVQRPQALTVLEIATQTSNLWPKTNPNAIATQTSIEQDQNVIATQTSFGKEQQLAAGTQTEQDAPPRDQIIDIITKGLKDVFKTLKPDDLTAYKEQDVSSPLSYQPSPEMKSDLRTSQQMYSPSLMSPFLSPIKSDANPGLIQGLKLFSTEKMPSETEPKDFQTQVIFADTHFELPENEPLGKNLNKQKTVKIDRNTDICIQLPPAIQTQRANMAVETNQQVSLEANKKKSSIQQSYQTSFRTEIFSSENSTRLANGPNTDQLPQQIHDPDYNDDTFKQSRPIIQQTNAAVNSQILQQPIQIPDHIVKPDQANHSVSLLDCLVRKDVITIPEEEYNIQMYPEQSHKLCKQCMHRREDSFTQQSQQHLSPQPTPIQRYSRPLTFENERNEPTQIQRRPQTFVNERFNKYRYEPQSHLHEISDEGHLQPSQSTYKEPRSQSRQHSISIRRESNEVVGNMIPIMLPKTNDQWRGKQIGATLYGDRVLGLGVEVSPTTDFERASPMTHQGSRKNGIKRQDTEMSEKEDVDMRKEWMRHSKLFNQQKQIMLQRMNSNQLLRKFSNMHEKQPRIQNQQYNLGDQDVAVTIQSSQAHPDVYQTQVGIRIGLENLSLGTTLKSNLKPLQKDTKKDLLKLRTQIDDIISNALKTDSASVSVPSARQIRVPIIETEETFTKQSSSVEEPRIALSESLDQDRDTFRSNIQTQTINEQIVRTNMETQTQMRKTTSMVIQTEPYVPVLSFKPSQHSEQMQTDRYDTQSVGTQYYNIAAYDEPVVAVQPKPQPAKEDCVLFEKTIAKPAEPVSSELLEILGKWPSALPAPERKSVQKQVSLPPQQIQPQISNRSKQSTQELNVEQPDQKGRGLFSMLTNNQKDVPASTEGPSPEDIMKMMKKQTAIAIKREIRRGDLTFKQLVNKFYELETNYLMKDYMQGLQLQFQYACVQVSRIIQDADSGERCIRIDDFISFMMQKKIKVARNLIHEICEGDSDVEAIRFISFVKLHILASCGGDKTKLGSRNFRKLMKHMDIISI